MNCNIDTMKISLPLAFFCTLITTSLLQASDYDPDAKGAQYTYELMKGLRKLGIFVKVSFNPEDETHLIAEGYNGDKRRWNLSNNTITSNKFFSSEPPPKKPSYHKIEYNPQRTQYARWAFDHLSLRNAKTHDVEHMLHTGGIYSETAGTTVVRYNASGTLFASGAPERVLVWDTKSGKLLFRHPLSAEYCWSLAFNPQKDQLAFATRDPECYDGTLTVWNFATEKVINTRKSWLHETDCLEYSPDGTRLVSLSCTDKDKFKEVPDDPIRIWNPDTLVCLQTIKSPVEMPLSVAFQNDGSTLAIGCWNGIMIFKKTAASEAPSKPIFSRTPSDVRKEKEREKEIVEARKAEELRNQEALDRELCLDKQCCLVQ